VVSVSGVEAKNIDFGESTTLKGASFLAAKFDGKKCLHQVFWAWLSLKSLY
jgi:hypothetical protein